MDNNKIEVPDSVEIPTKIKNIYIELDDYQFNHSATSGKYFTGREQAKSRLKSLLLNSGSCAGGAYLVTGYRGMGKTTLVNQVLTEVIEGKESTNDFPYREYVPMYIRIDISLSQDDIKDLDVLKYISSQLFREWILLDILKKDVDSTISSRYKMILEFLSKLCDSLESIVKHTLTKDLRKKNDENYKNKHTTEFIHNQPLPKEIEKELIYILDQISEFRALNPKTPYFVFVLDEIDKIEPNYFYDLETKAHDTVTQSDLDNLFGINKVRRRQEVVARLLANLKSFLSRAKAKFIFIGGREMYDASLADIADRDSFYSSIFHDVIYVNSFFKDKLEKSSAGLTRLTETYLCKLLIPSDKINKYISTKSSDISENLILSQDHHYTLFNYYRYLIDLYSGKNMGQKASMSDISDEVQKLQIYKIIFFVQNLIIFLTFRSNGTPKKLVNLIESYVVDMSGEQQERLKKDFSNIILPFKDKDTTKKRLFLRFNHQQQYEVGLTTNIYRPYILVHSRHLKSLGDKLLYSTAFILDYLLKYHPHAFSWRNLELLPEIILVNKDPNLRYFLNDILKFLSNIHIRETTTGIFQYKFYSKQANEIKLLTKISESASAAFNFTLDESLHIIRYFRRKLDNLKKSHRNHDAEYIHSIGFLQNILGDLYYFDKEYDEAIVYYADSVQVLRQIAQRDPAKMTKHQCILYVYHSLLIGLCLEKIKAFDTAYAIYRELILITPDPNGFCGLGF